MNTTTEIGDRREFLLTKAVLIYQEQVLKQEQFATVHNVFTGDEKGAAPRLGPGSLLTKAFLKKLCLGLLPENVLAYSSDLLVWWTAPRLRPMFFSHGAEDRAAINGRTCPHPALVWKVRHGRLYLRALIEAARPRADTELMVAPYWNIEVTRGDVCEGDMLRPAETDVTTILQWEEGFFNSRFTHPSGIGQLTCHPGGFIGLWTELVTCNHFPVHNLVAANQTLGQFVQDGVERNQWNE